MPNIRDLGINSIPTNTPLPPPGLDHPGYLMDAPKDDDYLPTECEPGMSCGGDEDEDEDDDLQETECEPGHTCGKDDDYVPTECEPGMSCGGDDGGDVQETECEPGHTCGKSPKSPKSPKPQDAGAFSPDAIAQLRQQLENHIGA